MKKKYVKLLGLLLVLALAATCLFACGKNEPGTPDKPGQETPGDPQQPGDPASPVVNMTESYAKGRAEFKAVTGIELPALENIAVEEFPYEEGATSYELDITENVTSTTFDTIVTFLDTALATWTKTGPTTDGDYTNIGYQSATGRIGITWDSHNTAVYVHAIMGGNNDPVNPEQPSGETDKMTASYKRGRDSFHEISGIWLPEFENIEADADSSFNTQKKEAQFIIAGNADTFSAVVGAVKNALAAEPLSDNNNHWEDEGFMAFWEWDYEAAGRMHKVTIQLENNSRTGKITAGYWFRDYYTLTLTAGEGGSAELKIAGRGQDGNTAHVVYNTSSDLYATPSLGYEFVGFYDGNTLLSAQSPLEGYMIVKDVAVEARFREVPSNMDAGYKAARKALYDMSGIVLPELENVTTDEEHSIVTFDPEGLRDEFYNTFTFASEEAATEAYATFKTAINTVEGDPEETMADTDLWSVLKVSGTVPYRDDVMMNVHGTSINLLWRKQPIVYYSVATEGSGTAYISYTDSSYQEQRVQRHWEIADGFHGKVVAVADDGYEFSGWYVDGASVSSDREYYFKDTVLKNAVDSTEITFTAKFTAIQMTDSYTSARASFQTATGLTLPALSGVTGMFEDLGSDMYMVDISGASQNTLTSVISAFDNQTNTTSTIDDYGKNVWKFARTDNDATCEVSAFYADGIVVVMYTEEAAPAMTESYAQGKEDFETITGFVLPELADCELLESSDLRTNQHTVACFDITGDADDLAAIVESLQAQINHAPFFSDEGGSTWLIEVRIGDDWYSGNISVMIDTGVDPVAIYVNYVVSEVDESYVYARDFFVAATGIELPLQSGLEVSFCIGGSDFMFDIVGGDSRSQYQYEVFEKFFDGTLAGWNKSGPAKADRDYTDGYTTIDYTTTGAMVDFVWDAENQAIYINATITEDDFAPLTGIIELFEAKFGLQISEYNNVSVMFSYEDMGITLNIAGDDLTYADYMALEDAFSDALGEYADGYPDGNENDGRDAQWIAGGNLFSTTWDPFTPAFDINVSTAP